MSDGHADMHFQISQACRHIVPDQTGTDIDICTTLNYACKQTYNAIRLEADIQYKVKQAGGQADIQYQCIQEQT